MTHLGDALFVEAIGALPPEFRSRDVIDYFYRFHQRAYVLELHENRDVATYPFTETHRQIGRKLHAFPHLIEKIGDGDEDEPSALWRRR
jgi:hypothetical protein